MEKSHHFQLLKDQVALVTGATAGIGKAIAIEFAKNGATVFGLGTNLERGKELEKQAEELTLRKSVHFIQADVAKKEEIEKAIQECLEKEKRLDILVNNAGITRDGLLLRMSEEDWDKVLQINLTSCFYSCQAALKPMIKAKKGKIINISSVVGLMGNPGQTNYAASKAGMIGFSKSLAKELASRNIYVNCIAPGYVETHMTEVLDTSLKEAVLQHIPMKRMGKPEEIASCALFLASALSDYITGQVIPVDGGLLM